MNSLKHRNQLRKLKIVACHNRVIKSRNYKNSKNLMYVVGATKAEFLADIRQIIPDSFLLVPGVGAQGGNLQDVCKYGMNKHIGLLINSSRGIIYASKNEDFANADTCNICKQPFNQQRGVNRHHWYFSPYEVEYALHQFVDSAVEKR